MSRCLPSSSVSSKTRMRHACPPLQGQPAGQDLALPCLPFCFLFRAAEEQENLLSCFLNTKWVGPARANIPSEYTPKLHRTETKAGPPVEGCPRACGALPRHPGKPRWCKVSLASPNTPAFSGRQTGPRQIKDGIRKRHRHREALPRKQCTGDSFSRQTGEQRDRGLLSPAGHIYRFKAERNRGKDQTGA